MQKNGMVVADLFSVRDFAHLRVDPIHPPQIAIRRQPPAQCVGVEKCLVSTFMRCAEHAMESDSLMNQVRIGVLFEFLLCQIDHWRLGVVTHPRQMNLDQ